MSSPRVGVVIPCFNHGRYLTETVESVLAQTFRELEVVVVDDGSTDDSAAVAEALCAAHADRVRLLRQPNAGHPSVARNNGIRATSSEYVLCLDADDQLPPDWMAACVAALDARPDAGVAYTDQQDFGATDRYHVVAEYDFRAQAHKNWFGICSLFRRAAWEAVGGWDARIALSEDWDFWIGCGYHGFPAIKVHGVAWLYRTSGDGRQAAIDMENDRHVKAQLVLKRADLYSETQQAWARGVLDGDPRALADEVVLRPELLEAYSRAFREDDDATLVIYTPGGDAESLVDRLGPVLAERGLDGDGGPDILAYGAPAGLGDSVLAACARAVLSCHAAAGPLGALPRFDGASVEALSALARA
ncbi:MAG: glycosyltransferase family 2 protein [Gaiellaceae bacterium]